MAGSGAQLRLSKRLYRARLAVESGIVSHREAARRYHIPKTTLQDALRRHKEGLPLGVAGRPPVFKADEEMLIVQMLLTYADRGVPLTRIHLTEAISLFVKQLPHQRRKSIPFANGRPGVKFLRSFERRHRERLRFAVPVRQEAKRFAAVNARTLAYHFETLKELMLEHNIDAHRLWNLDETGSTPGRDASGNGKRRRYLRRRGELDLKLPDFVRTGRTSLMPVVSAAGDVGPPLFVFKGTSLPYRNVIENGNIVTQTYTTYLPRGACVAMRAEGGGIDIANFLSWAQLFVSSVKDLTSNGRKVLLTYDGYAAHMSLPVLQLFRTNNIVVYALPAHTSGKLQPLDVVAFSVYKRNLNNLIAKVVRADATDELDMFHFCAIMREAFYESFTRENIRASFKRSGMWPINADRLLGKPLPHDDDDVGTTLQPSELARVYEESRTAARRAILGNDVTLLRNGNVNTRRGAVLTSDGAMAKVLEKSKADTEKIERDQQAAAQRELRQARVAQQKQREREKLDAIVLGRRARAAGMAVEQYRKTLRPMKLRRALAKSRKAQKLVAAMDMSPQQLMADAMRLARAAEPRLTSGDGPQLTQMGRVVAQSLPLDLNEDGRVNQVAPNEARLPPIALPGSLEGASLSAHSASATDDGEQMPLGVSDECAIGSAEGAPGMTVLVDLAVAAREELRAL